MLERRIISTYLFLVFGLGLNYVYSIVAAKVLGATEFGIYIYCLSLFNIAAIIANSELDKASIKFVAAKSDIDKYKSSIHIFGLLTSTLISLIFIGLIIHVFEDKLKQNLFLYASAIPLYVLLTINLSFLQAEHITSKRLAIKYLIEPISKMALLFSIAWLYTHFYVSQPKAIHAAVALVGSLVFANLSCLLLFFNKTVGYTKQVTAKNISQVFSFVSPLFASNIAGVIGGKMDILIIGLLVAISDLGVYGAALQTSAMLAIILQGLEMVFAPNFSENLAAQQHSSLATNYKKSLRLSLLLALPLVILFVCYSDSIMQLYGEEYKAGSNVLTALAIAQLCNLATGSANLLIIVTGKTRIVLYTNLLYVLLSALCITIGTLTGGIFGASCGVLLSTLTLNTIRVIAVYKILRIHPYSKFSFTILLSITLTYLFYLVTQDIIGLSGIIFYPAVAYTLILLSGLHPDDYRLVKCLLNPRTKS